MSQQITRHRHIHSIRRFVGSGLILLSLAMIVGATVYAYSTRQNILPKGGTTPQATTAGTPPTPTGTPPASTCTTPQHSPGNSTLSIFSAGLNRSFIIHLPPSYGQQPQPLVLVYHAYSFTAQKMANYTNMAAEADQAGFIVVFPQGVGSIPSWNAGVGTGYANDVQFTRDLLSFVKKNYCVDSHRVYVSGYSLGGGMAYRIACTLTNQFAAIATVAGAYYHAPGGCHPSHPIPVLEIHGQADRYAPYNGNPAAGMVAVQVYLNVWLNRDGCTATHSVFFQKGDVTGIQWTHCAAGTVIIHYRVSDGGHTWPGRPDIGLGYTTHVIDANMVIWNFFSHYMS